MDRIGTYERDRYKESPVGDAECMRYGIKHMTYSINMCIRYFVSADERFRSELLTGYFQVHT